MSLDGIYQLHDEVKQLRDKVEQVIAKESVDRLSGKFSEIQIQKDQDKVTDN